MKKIISKFKKDPLGLIKRGLYKLIIGPLKYGKGNDYNASRYWHDRFSKYGLSFKGAGHEGLAEAQNKKMYEEAAKVFIALCNREDINFHNAKVLEIGCGNGFYTKLLYNLGVKDYIGVDITNVLFPVHRKNFPEFKFIRKDITKDKIEGKFDLILMIDVIQHIVNKDKLTSALDNIKNCLSDNGIFMVSPIKKKSKRHLFYVRWWSLEDIKRQVNGYILKEMRPFRNDNILVVRKPLKINGKNKV